MKLTGKAKAKFEKWLEDNYGYSNVEQIMGDGYCHHLNLQPLLIKHNLQKSDSLPWEWIISPKIP